MLGVGENSANTFSEEGTVTTSKVVTFAFRSQRLIVTNDSATKDIVMTLKQAAFTLKPLETFSADVRADRVTLACSGSAAYRVWVLS